MRRVQSGQPYKDERGPLRRQSIVSDQRYFRLPKRLRCPEAFGKQAIIEDPHQVFCGLVLHGPQGSTDSTSSRNQEGARKPDHSFRACLLANTGLARAKDDELGAQLQIRNLTAGQCVVSPSTIIGR